MDIRQKISHPVVFHFEQTIHPDDLQYVGETLIGNLVNHVDAYEFEYRGLFPGDRLVWFSLQANVERDEDGVAVLQTGTFIDITDIKKAEAQREAAQAQTQKLFDISRKLNAAGDLQEILTAIVESIGSVEFDRAMLVSHDLGEDNNIEALNFIANWAGTENAQVVPIGMIMPASGFPAVSIFEKPEIHLINDYETDERFDEALKKWLSDQGVRSGLLMPLFDGDKPLAGVIVESATPANFSEIERRLMELAASQVTAVVQNELLLQATTERAQALATVAEVSTAVTATQDPQVVLKQVVDLTKERFGLYHAHVYQMNAAGDTLELVSGAGEVGDQMVAEKRSIPFAAEQSLVARAARSKAGVIVNDVTADPNFLPHPLLPETKAELAVPMLAGEDVIGVLDVQASGMRRFDQDDVVILTTLASQAAVALPERRAVRGDPAGERSY